MIGEPFALDHFGVVVQEKQPGAVGLFDGKIIHRGKIEGAAVTQDPVFRSCEKYARASSDWLSLSTTTIS